MKKTWTDVTPPEFLDLVRHGHSYTKIGIMFGISRNAVSGKVLRWKKKGYLPDVLPGHRSNSQRMSTGQRTRVVMPKPVSKKPLGFEPEIVVEPPRLKPKPVKFYSLDNPQIEGTVPVSILDKTTFMCAVVVGRDDAGFPTYCGCRITNFKFRMCEGHASYMLETALVRRRNRQDKWAIADARAAG